MSLLQKKQTDTTNVNGSKQSKSLEQTGYYINKLKKEQTLQEYYECVKPLTKNKAAYISNGRSYNHSDKDFLNYLEQKYIQDTGNPLDIREAIELLMEETQHVEDNNLWHTLSSRS